jgi:hypothetical protein
MVSAFGKPCKSALSKAIYINNEVIALFNEL